MAHKCNGCVWCRRTDENRVFCRRVRCVKVNRFSPVIGSLEQIQQYYNLLGDEHAAVDVAIEVLLAEG